MKGGFTMNENEKLVFLDEHIKKMTAICEKRIAVMKAAGIGDESQYKQMRANNEALIKLDIETMFRPSRDLESNEWIQEIKKIKKEVIKW